MTTISCATISCATISGQQSHTNRYSLKTTPYLETFVSNEEYHTLWYKPWQKKKKKERGKWKRKDRKIEAIATYIYPSFNTSLSKKKTKIRLLHKKHSSSAAPTFIPDFESQSPRFLNPSSSSRRRNRYRALWHRPWSQERKEEV